MDWVCEREESGESRDREQRAERREEGREQIGERRGEERREKSGGGREMTIHSLVFFPRFVHPRTPTWVEDVLHEHGDIQREVTNSCRVGEFRIVHLGHARWRRWERELWGSAARATGAGVEEGRPGCRAEPDHTL